MDDLSTQTQQPRLLPQRQAAVSPIRRRARFSPLNALASPLDTETPPRPLVRDAIFRRSLMVADIAAAGLAFLAVALATRQGVAPTWAGLAALPVVVLAAKLFGLYDRDELVFHKSTLDEVPSLFYLASACAMLAWLLHPVLLDGDFGRGETLGLWGSFFVSVLVARSLARMVSGRLSPAERCLVIGPSGARARFSMKLARARSRQTEVVGHLPLEDERRSHRRPIKFERRQERLMLADLESRVQALDVHRVVIIPGDAEPDTLLEAVSRAKAVGVKVSILPRVFEVMGSSVEFDDLEGQIVLGVRRFGLGRSSWLIKRTMDASFAGLGLIVLAPLFALVAAAVKLDNPGPVLFRQLRVGRSGVTFEMLKFRSMIDGAERQRDSLLALNETEGLFKITADPRVTRVGSLLRKTSLDELPQLINVLRGEMSLVGPRPLVLDEDSQVEGWHRGRLQMTPGMTGPWQLLGPTRVPLADMVNIDYLYGANWSLWADIKILLRTLGHVATRSGL